MKPEATVEPDITEAAPRENRSDPVADSEPMSFPRMLRRILQCRKFILRVMGIVVVLTLVVVFLIPNKYTASSVVLPPAGNSSISSMLLSQVTGGSGSLASLAGAGLGLKSSGDMYVSLFRSRSVEDALIQRFRLMEHYREKRMVDTRLDFERRSTVVLGAKDGLIRIEITDWDPKFAAVLANAYVDEFRKHVDSLALTESSQRRAFFEQQLRQANEDLTRSEEALKQTQQSTGVLQLDSQARALIESAAVLRGQIAAKQVELQSMQSFATERNPEYRVVQQQLDALRAQLAKVAGTGSGSETGIGLTRTDIPQAGMTYLKSLRDFRYYETIDELIAKQYEAAKLDEAREGTIQISDLAVPPDKKSSPHRALIVLLTGFLALLAAIFWVLYGERWKAAFTPAEPSDDLSENRRLR